MAHLEGDLNLAGAPWRQFHWLLIHDNSARVGETSLKGLATGRIPSVFDTGPLEGHDSAQTANSNGAMVYTKKKMKTGAF